MGVGGHGWRGRQCRCWPFSRDQQVLNTTTGHRLVFSGDTVPCEELARAGRDAHLLIHEVRAGRAVLADC